jgi:hypothetical protein
MSEAAAVGEPRAARSVPSWVARNPAIACLVVAVVASAALQMALNVRLTIFGDEWAVVLDRGGHSLGAFLDPHNGHLIVAVVVYYKLILALFGLSSPVPFRVVSVGMYLLAAVLLFVYMRRRIGDWLALLGTSVILFFGAASVDLLSPFQILFSGGIAAGIGALLALDRDDARGDAIACVLLLVSTSFSEVGLAFAVGVLVRLALSRRPLAGRLYVVGVPVVLYALWWLGWGHTARSDLTLRHVMTAPRYVFDEVGTAVGALLGITSSGDQLPQPVGSEWAPVLLVVAVGLAIWRVARLGGVPRGVWPVLAVGLTFWALAAFNAGYVRVADNARFLFPSGVFILLIASELWRGARLEGRAVLVGAIAAGLAIAGNLVFLSDGYSRFYRPVTQTSRADLRALEIAAPAARPSFVFSSGLIDISLASYLAAVRAWGSPAYSEAELASSPEWVRVDADHALGKALALTLEPGGRVNGPCRVVQASATGSNQVELGPGRVSFKAPPGPEAKVALGRFSEELPVSAGTLRPGSRATLAIPRDASVRPWHLGLVGRGPVTVCGPGMG